MTYYANLLSFIKGTKLAFLVTNNYIYAFLMFLTFFILAYIVVFIIKRYILFLVKKTKTNLDDKLIEAVNHPIFYLLIFLGVYFGLTHLELSEKVSFYLGNTVLSLIYLGVGVIVARVSSIFVSSWGKKWAKKTKATLDDDLLPWAHKTISVVIYIIVFLIILKRWNVDITGLMAGLGIAGLAIGFAVKDSLANLFGGIAMILDKNIKVGDKIKINDKTSGIVKDIGLRSTKLRSFDNEVIIIPNGKLVNSQIQNFVLPDPKARANINFSVEYGSDIEKVKAVVLNAMKNVEHVLKDPEPSVNFLEMGESSLNFVCRVWVDHYNKAYSTKVKATEVIYNTLNKEKIGIPFPTRTVYVDKIKVF